jgi:DNA-directed RNA polymerase specialized sigma24 family protein
VGNRPTDPGSNNTSDAAPSRKTPPKKKSRGRARFEIEGALNSLSVRERRRLFNPWADFVWRNGRMFIRSTPAERAARRRRGDLEDLVFDVWAAFHFGDEAAIDWFLSDYLHLYPNKARTAEDLREALYYVVGTQWADRPAQEVHKHPPRWSDPHTTNPKGYLYVAIKEEAERRNRDRGVADKPWGLKRLHTKKHLPTQCALSPEALGHEAVSVSGDILDELVAFQHRELQVFLEQAKRELPERQYQVLALRAEGHGYGEIGRKLRISPSAAKSHMTHARRNPRLRRIAERWKGGRK